MDVLIHCHVHVSPQHKLAIEKSSYDLRHEIVLQIQQHEYHLEIVCACNSINQTQCLFKCLKSISESKLLGPRATRSESICAAMANCVFSHDTSALVSFFEGLKLSLMTDNKSNSSCFMISKNYSQYLFSSRLLSSPSPLLFAWLLKFLMKFI